LPGRLETLHLPLPTPSWSMRVFSPAVQIAALPVFCVWQQFTLRHPVTLQLIGHDHPRCISRTLQKPPKEALRDAGIASRLNKDVQHYLWRAVDQDGVVLDILVQARRDANAAKRFFKRLLKGLQYVPRVIVTDKLRSYGVAQRQLLPGVEHRQTRYLNNRAENSHRPTRRRERQRQRFKSTEQAQNFLSAHAFIYGHFHPRRHQLPAHACRVTRSDAFKLWQQETCAGRAA